MNGRNGGRRNSMAKARHRHIMQIIRVSVFMSNRSKRKGKSVQVDDRSQENAICFSLKNSWKYDHGKVKLLVETQIKCKVKSVEFDPLSKRSSNRSLLDRWIVGLPTRILCYKAIEHGLVADGCHVVVRYWNDVVSEETGSRPPLYKIENSDA
ncbi:hypothetical protein ACF0H5_009943 [Mactra antiquata]